MPCCSVLPGPLRLWEPAARVVLFCVCSDPCGSDHSKCGWCIRGNACLILAGLSQLIMIWDGILPLDFHLASLHFPPTLWCFPLSLLSSLLFCFILSCFMLFLVSDFGLFHLFHFLCFSWWPSSKIQSCRHHLFHCRWLTKSFLPSAPLCLTQDLYSQWPSGELHLTDSKACPKLGVSNTVFTFPLIRSISWASLFKVPSAFLYRIYTYPSWTSI